MARPKKIAPPKLPEPPPDLVVDVKRIKRALDESDLAVWQLGLLAGIGQRTLARILSGKHNASSRFVDIGRIATVLNLSLDEIAPKPKSG
jgi:hypothetical protein